MKVLVTGGTGFLGAYIIRELVSRGHEVKAIRRSNSLPVFIDQAILEKATWLEGDVLDIVSLQDAMEGMDAVVHSAAVVSFHKAERKKMYSVNVEGTANVVNAALETGVKRFLHVSSVAALGRTKSGDEVNEEKKWQESKINTHYAISKYKAELEVWRGFAEGLEGVIVNPGTILGYGDWNNSSTRIFKNVYEEFAWYTNGVNGFVDVEDVAKATVLLLESDITEQRFILNGENISFRDLFNLMADAFDKKRPHKEASARMGEFAWRLEKLKSFFTGKKPLLTKESARVAQSKTRFDNRKILQALPGFSFTPLKDSVNKACKQYHAGNKKPE